MIKRYKIAPSSPSQDDTSNYPLFKSLLATANQQKASTLRGVSTLKTIEQMGVTDGVHCFKERIWFQFHSIIFLYL